MDGADAPEGGGSGPTPAPNSDDTVLPFQLDRLDLRGRVARLDETLNQILGQHRYPRAVAALVGETALLAALIGQAMKLRGRFSLQARGDGPVALLAADYFAPEEPGAPARMRAYAHFEREMADPDPEKPPHQLLGEGVFAMTIDQGAHMQPYQGLTPLAGGGLGECAEIYFAQSEQIATRFHLALGQTSEPGGVERWRAGGVMIQHLAPFGEGAAPPEGASDADGLMRADDVIEAGDRAEAWRTATTLLETAEPIELVGPHVSVEQLLWRLFHEETPRVYDRQPIAFGCTCRAEKVETLLKTYDEATLREMSTEAGDIVADCQFCGAQYRFDIAALAADRATE